MRTRVQWGLLLLAGTGFLLAAAGEARARPGYGSSCNASGCHTGTRDNSMEVTNYAKLLNLDAVNLPTATDRGELRTYIVKQGESVTLSMNVLDGSSNYAVELKRLEKGGVMNSASNTLVYGADGSWAARTDPNTGVLYFTRDADQAGEEGAGFDWTSGPVPYTFELFVDAATPADTYDLEFAVAGRRPDSPRSWYDDEHFYLQVDPVPEPASWVMFSGLGLCLAWYWRRRKAVNR